MQDVLAGHPLLPRFNDELLPDKPILYHWLAALPCAVVGFSEAAVRLPSALAGAGLVWWTARFGGQLLGAQAGLVAGVLLATTPALFTHARVARPDVLLALLLSAALGCAFRWWSDRRRGDATAALALLGTATLAKGPVAPALFVVALGGFLAWQRDLRSLRAFPTLPGLAACAVLGLGWYAVALAGWGELFVHEHLRGRYLRNLLGGLPQGEAYSPRPLLFHLFFYPKHLPAVTLPWTPLVVVALWHAWRRGGLRDPRLRFLLCWALASVVVFTPAEWKLRYYLLPSLPPLMLATAPAVLRLWRAAFGRAPDNKALLVAGAVVVALVAVAWGAMNDVLPLARSDRATLAALVTVLPGGTQGAAVAIGLVAGALLGAIAWRAWSVLIVLAAAGTALWMFAGVPALEQAISRRDSLRGFAEEAARRYPVPAPLVFFPETIRPVAVYARRRVSRVPRRRELPAEGGVIAPEPAYQRLAKAGVLGPPEAIAAGRVGNVTRERVVLSARASRPDPPRPATPAPSGPGSTSP